MAGYLKAATWKDSKGCIRGKTNVYYGFILEGIGNFYRFWWLSYVIPIAHTGGCFCVILLLLRGSDWDAWKIGIIVWLAMRTLRFFLFSKVGRSC